MITTIPNLILSEKITLTNFELHPNLSQDYLQKEFDLDFEIMNLIQKKSWTSSSILIWNFEGKDDSSAYSSAVEFAFHVVNILALYQPSIIFIERGPLWVNEIEDSGRSRSVKGDLISVTDSHYREKIKLDVQDFEDFENFFKHCYEFFAKENKTKIENSIYDAYYWFGKFRKTISPYDRLIFSTILLESLIGSGSEITYKISHRCATLLGENSKIRGDIFDMIKKYYGQRSTIVHGKRESFSNSDLYNLTEAGRSLILRFISLSKQNPQFTREDILNKLDRSIVDDDLRKTLQSQSDSLFINRSKPNFKNFS